MANRELRPEDIPAYSIEQIENIKELNTCAYRLKHRKTGANVAVLINDDDNKVFTIGFRTPPVDDAGLPHILEHSVLCGSKKYPAKNPFEELAQGSLNTFLNAMTYPDKTIYPVASCNLKDFKNLMDVYLDAVFYPNVCEREEIFKQEGWHYELENKEDRLSYNGVVYNEMKGAFSDPDGLLERKVNKALFPDTCYSFESGGDPEFIPTLSYEKFVEFYKKYYHPSNSYIYLYGDMDMAERLDYMDKEYLSAFDALDIDSEIASQPAFDEKKIVNATYPIGSDEDEKDKGYLSYNVVTADAWDKEAYLAFDIIAYALVNMPGAPLKQKLIDAGIGKDVSGGLNGSLKQMFFSINSRNVDTEKIDAFTDIIESYLSEVVQHGLNKKALTAAINVSEFRFREADYGNYPKGLYYGLYVFDSWLYDETKPFVHLEAADTYKVLKSKVETGYFEELIDKYILNNNHKCIAALSPEKGKDEVRQKLLQEKLDAFKDSLSNDEIEKIVADTEALKEYQSEPSPKEDVEKLPVLKISDIDKEPKYCEYEIREEEVKVLYTDISSNGIGYVNASFDCKYVPKKLIPYLELMRSVLAYMDTEKYTYADLNTEINMHTGGIGKNLDIYNVEHTDDDYEFRFEMRVKATYGNMDKAFDLLNEILLNTKVENEKRLKEIIAERVIKIHSTIINAGHSVALFRALSYLGEKEAISELILGGIGTYEFYKSLEDNFEYDEIVKNLREVMRLVLNKNNMFLAYTSDAEGYEAMKANLHRLTDNLPTESLVMLDDSIEVKKRNEAIIIPSPVSYTARVGNFKNAGYSYTGTLRTLKNALDYGYLWNNVRVLGGAYGVMSFYSQNSGNMGYMSYRDPNVGKTSETFLSVPEFLKNFEADERELRKYIIGAISGMDKPLSPSGKAERSYMYYICNRNHEDLKKERQEVLELKLEDIRKTSALIEAVMKQGYICTVGNKEKIMESKELFDEIREIF